MKTARILALAALAGTAFAANASTPVRQGNASTTFASAFVTAMQTGTLRIITDGSQQQIEIEVGPLPGEVRVFGVAGIPDGVPFMNVTDLLVRTGAAQDFVEVRVFATEIPNITVNTGEGNSDVKFIYFTPFTLDPVTTFVNVVGGTGNGNDKVGFEVFSDADSFSADWNVNHRAGDNETTVNIDSPEFSSFLGIDLFASGLTGIDKVDAVIKSSAAAIDVAFATRGGDNNDSAILALDILEPSALTVDLDVVMGTGDDVAEVLTVLRGGTADLTGRVLGGDGIDTLKLLQEGDGSANLTFNGGNGNDNIDMEYKGAVSGAPFLVGAAGDDFLKIIADTPALMSPTLNGGLGFDQAIGFGRFISVESIN